VGRVDPLVVALLGRLASTHSNMSVTFFHTISAPLLLSCCTQRLHVAYRHLPPRRVAPPRRGSEHLRTVGNRRISSAHHASSSPSSNTPRRVSRSRASSNAWCN
jgi:hypothetical protein